MSIQVSKEEFEFLNTVQSLGVQGNSQDEIARAVGLETVGALKYRLANLGFRPQPGNVLKTTLGNGELFADLLSRNAIEVTPDLTEQAA